MNIWFKKKSRIETLQERYTLLMKRSFEIALKDIQRSKKLHHQADKLFDEITYLKLQQADK